MEYNGLIFIQRHCAFLFCFWKGLPLEKTPTNQLKTPKILRFVIDLHNLAILSPSFTDKALVKMDHHCPSIGASDKWIHEKQYENMFLCFFGLKNDRLFSNWNLKMKCFHMFPNRNIWVYFQVSTLVLKTLSTPLLFCKGLLREGLRKTAQPT